MSLQYANTGRRRAGTIESSHFGQVAASQQTRPLSAVTLKHRSEVNPSIAVTHSTGRLDSPVERLPFNSRPQLPGDHFLVPATPSSTTSHPSAGLASATSPRPKQGIESSNNNKLLLRERSATASRLVPTVVAVNPAEQRLELSVNGNPNLLTHAASLGESGLIMQTRHADEGAAWEARKRRNEDDVRFVSPRSSHAALRASPQTRTAALREESRPLPPRMLSGATASPGGYGASPHNGHASPHMQLPSFNHLASGGPDDPVNGKRRRVTVSRQDEEARARDAYDYVDEDEEAYRAAARARRGPERDGAAHYSPESRHYAAGPPQNGPVPTSAEAEQYEGVVPLSRRRGDLAHAKASRLHIDVGNSGSPTAADLPSSGSRRTNAPTPVARSAPAHKISFDGEPGLSSRHPGAHQSPSGAGMAQAPIGRRVEYEIDERYAGASPPQRGLAPRPEPAGSQRSAMGHGYAAPLASARFVPQTATLPSPAYHTTAFMRGGGPPGAPPGGGAAPPRTAGLPQPPPTARLPEHLRSPPSSKTQFLALFSNFYDSLTDSRTLKATLEDQVRRSNTLLQTLQRSSRVLDATVDRRIKEERGMWETRVHTLEDRVRELEGKLGIASDEPASQRGPPAAEIRRAEASTEVTTDPNAPVPAGARKVGGASNKSKKENAAKAKAKEEEEVKKQLDAAEASEPAEDAEEGDELQSSRGEGE
ncbi:hypothetical protein IE81DRAFT_344957 [Ceraceosorus guamensis]|uniref:Uncharacterized protein n=1 Tax=Ceraceosorus guamensis TaxID=1522189 RepID=A0A316W5X2_9BASI|nr:hypothetical protein IE81DRAFT_344957 [Ceraceosorus guamensis]PWN45269.1 hypothetical protein IE81DRAFT_344957 [Ceraceosorus guamensis]